MVGWETFRKVFGGPAFSSGYHRASHGVVVLDRAGGHTLRTDHLLDEPFAIPHVVKNHEDRGIGSFPVHEVGQQDSGHPSDSAPFDPAVPLCRVHVLL